MKVLFVPTSTSLFASSRIRIYQYLPFLTTHGVEAKVIPFFPHLDHSTFVSRHILMQRLAEKLHTLKRTLLISVLAPQYDVTLIQRVLLPASLQRLLSRRSRALIFDFDDALYTIHPAQSRTASWIAREQARFAHMLQISQAVIVSTPYLATIARRYQSRVIEIISPVDCERYRPVKRSYSSSVIVGWIGSPLGTIYLEPLFPVFERLAKVYPALRFELVGADPRMITAPAWARKWSLETELEYLHTFDIGMMPLPDDEWSRAKAGYKLLQYMACGIACIASPVGINQELIRHGETGFLARDAADWEQALIMLIENPPLRQRIGQAGREIVEREYSLHVWAPRFLSALETLANRTTSDQRI